ncbi:proline--tRNA ligase [Caldalkalibacillus thermarum]|uniref:proline--tRNA ligase n=1 Tax=Caldalkalibacillus thermarum TaxID=296745 RepID=UPI00166991CE|nr:proline--tRNA ligase [Caldalkalibacillus thermarum]GGK13485.1 proline--tRNA ligase [Caldalkalibacillus thermarum]
MRQQHYLIPTLRDIPADAEVVSHQLMLRAGLIRQLASGLYTYLPLAQKVLKKIQAIIREEMDKAGAQEILMPALHPAEIWQETGRWDVYGPELMRLYDRHERQFALGPTHEEVVTALVRDEIKSYKRLPMTVYQIQTKFRDERRPRFGVLRAREFIMKDAYSFDTSHEGLDESYRKMYEAYQAIFSRCGLNFRAVEADSGAIGGTGTHEFMVLSDVGEDTIAYCDSCQYAANIEKAEVNQRDYRQIESTGQPMEKVNTPQAKTVTELVDMLDVSPRQIIKAVALDVDGQVVVALVRGDFELNEVKVKNLFGADRVELLDEERIRAELGSEPGFIGPIGLDGAKIIADHSVKGMQDAVTGANEKDKHYIHVSVGRDFAVERYEDLRQITEGDACPRCEGTIRFAKGIEVGHVFKLGTKYSEAMGATFLDENGHQQPMIMGCYGIGVTRLLAAIIEQHHDEHGIIWPRAVAPFDIHLISVNMKDDMQRELAEQLYVKLQQAGFDVLYDDREERAGVKFKDADLIGIPLRVTVGKKAGDGIVECKLRRTGETEEIKADELIQILPRLLEQA